MSTKVGKEMSAEEKKIIDQLVYNLEIGIPGIESSGNKNPYSAQNPDSSAAGKYQFLKSWLPKIQSFAKENGMPVPKDMEEFKSVPDLQDSFFRFYSETELYPQAKAILSKGNPENLTIEETASLIHLRGYGNAEKEITTGKFAPATKKGVDGAKYDNVSSLDYLKKVTKTIENNGGTYISKKDLIAVGVKTKQTKEQIISSFEKEQAFIDNNKYLSQGQKEKKRAELFQNVANSGDAEIINEHITKANATNKVAYEQKLNDYNDLKEIVESARIGYDTEGFNFGLKNDAKRKFNKDEAYISVNTKEDRAKYEKLKEKYDFFIDGKGKNYPSGVVMNTEKMLATFEKQHLELTGETIKIVPGNDGVPNEKGSYGVINKEPLANGLDLFKGNHRKGLIKLEGLGPVQNKFKEQPIIKVVPRSRAKANEEAANKKEEEAVKKETPEAEKEKAVETEKETAKKEVIPNEGLTSQFFKNELALNSTNDQEYNYTPGKKDLPIDAIVGMSLGLIGNEQAKNAKIPLRTEEVSLAMKNYTAELMKKSKEGLPVEVEAQMKAMLADAYQGGLENIVNASGGNSATVLGNLGQLEQAKNKGLVGIQVADYEAKDRAFAQYGKAIEYINDFDTRREIANHEIKYREGKDKQIAGKDLATAGFAKMIDAIKYDRENGPGSANDMYRGLLMQKMFGYDPKAKDDGKGTTVGTKSWYEANKQVAKDKFKITEGLHKTFQTLNPAQQAATDNVIAQTQDPTTLTKFMDYIQRGDVDPTKINMERFNQAITSDDMGLLSKATPTTQTPIATNPVKELANITAPTQSPNLTAPMLATAEAPLAPIAQEPVIQNGLLYPGNSVEAPVIAEQQPAENPLTQFNQFYK